MFLVDINGLAKATLSNLKKQTAASAQDWKTSRRHYVDSLNRIQAMRDDGCAAGTIRKDLMATWKEVIEKYKSVPGFESDAKAKRAVYKPFFENGMFENGGQDWEAYMSQFEFQADFRKAQRNPQTEPTEPTEGATEGATDPQKIDAAWSILASCDDLESAIADINARALAMVQAAA